MLSEMKITALTLETRRFSLPATERVLKTYSRSPSKMFLKLFLGQIWRILYQDKMTLKRTLAYFMWQIYWENKVEWKIYSTKRRKYSLSSRNKS